MQAIPTPFLLVPSDGPKTMRGLQRKLRLYTARWLLTYPTQILSKPLQKSMNRVLAVLQDSLKVHGPAFLEALGNPDVMTPLLVLDSRLGDPEILLPEAIPPLLAELSARRALTESVFWDIPFDRLIDSHGRRVLVFDQKVVAMVADPSGLSIQLSDGRKLDIPHAPKMPEEIEGVSLLRPFHTIDPAMPHLYLSEVDSNPLWKYEAHPEKTGNEVDLGGHSVEEWTTAYREALELIRIGLPEWYDEMPHSIERVLPVGYEAQRHLSASYREAPMVAYFTLHPDPVTLAEALVHETQHGKLNVLLRLDPVLKNGLSCWTESPVRPDLRPLLGVLLAVHAFVPVAAMHMRLADANYPVQDEMRFLRRRAQVIAGNTRGMQIVNDLGEWTKVGDRMLAGLNELHDFTTERAPEAPKGMDLEDALPPG